MKKLIALTAVTAFAALSGQAQASNSLTFQGVTFETQALDADTLQFSILNATHATGDWSGVHFLKAFELKGLGPEVASASIVSGPTGFTPDVAHGLAANGLGCGTGGTTGVCFSSTTPLALTDSMTWKIDFVASGVLDLTSPHVKVQFLKAINSTKKSGNLLSQNLPVNAVPEPETYAMLLAGLGVIGTIARRRVRK